MAGSSSGRKKSEGGRKGEREEKVLAAMGTGTSRFSIHVRQKRLLLPTGSDGQME